MLFESDAGGRFVDSVNCGAPDQVPTQPGPLPPDAVSDIWSMTIMNPVLLAFLPVTVKRIVWLPAVSVLLPRLHAACCMAVAAY